MIRWTTRLAALLVLVHAVLWDVVRWNGHKLVADPTLLVFSDKAMTFRVSLFADALGSYLLTLPATYALWRLLRSRGGRILDVLAVGAVVYALAGAYAAIALATFGGSFLVHSVSAGQALAFKTDMNAALDVWQILCVIGGGAWWLGSGVLLRDRWRWFARFSMAFGAASIALGLAKAFGANLQTSAPVTLAFAPIALWIGWLGWCLSGEADVTPLA